MIVVRFFSFLFSGLSLKMTMQFGGILESSDGVSETSDVTVSPFALHAITGGRTATTQHADQAAECIICCHRRRML